MKRIWARNAEVDHHLRLSVGQGAQQNQHQIAGGDQGARRGGAAEQVTDGLKLQDQCFTAGVGRGLTPEDFSGIVGDGEIATEQLAECRADFFMAGGIKQLTQLPLTVKAEAVL